MHKINEIKARHTLAVNVKKVGERFKADPNRKPNPTHCHNGHQVTKLCLNICRCGAEVR